MSINFEECIFCGKMGLREEARVKYNQSRGEFYYTWECFYCGAAVYETADPSEWRGRTS